MSSQFFHACQLENAKERTTTFEAKTLHMHILFQQKKKKHCMFMLTSCGKTYATQIKVVDINTYFKFKFFLFSPHTQTHL